MVSVLQANLISCRVGFVLSCFFKSMFSCSLLWRERYSRPFHWALTLSINTRVVDRAAIELNRRVKSEVGSWESEVGNRKSEVGSGKSEAGNRKSEVRSRKSEVGSEKGEVESWRSEGLAIQLWVWTVRNQKSGVRTLLSLKSEVGSRKSEVGRPSSAFVLICGTRSPYLSIVNKAQITLVLLLLLCNHCFSFKTSNWSDIDKQSSKITSAYGIGDSAQLTENRL